MGNVYNILAGKPEGKILLEDLGVDKVKLSLSLTK
jgi:hypothetical protein